jgi:large subunit ribosomal protein L21
MDARTNAIIRTGGKQYLVSPGKTYQFEKLTGDSGESVVFDDVLLTFTNDGSAVQIGTPNISGTTVTGTIAAQERTPKVRVVKYRAKSRYRRVHGHRQHVTSVRIDAIGSPKPPQKKEEAPSTVVPESTEAAVAA